MKFEKSYQPGVIHVEINLRLDLLARKLCMKLNKFKEFKLNERAVYLNNLPEFNVNLGNIPVRQITSKYTFWYINNNDPF